VERSLLVALMLWFIRQKCFWYIYLWWRRWWGQWWKRRV